MTVRGEIWRTIKKANKEKIKRLIISDEEIDKCKYCAFNKDNNVCNSYPCSHGILQYLNQETEKMRMKGKI